MTTPEDARIRAATTYCGTLEQMDPADRARVRDANLGYVRRAGITSVEANVVYAIARKASAASV